jgi:hypothetical protein
MGESFEEWLARSAVALEADCYRRQDNALIAVTLLPLFEDVPARWAALRYLNMRQPRSVREYFATWSDVAPIRHRETVSLIESCLHAALG